MLTVVIAEKPSVARDLAAVLGARQRKPASLEGNGYIVTWAIGHLVGLAEPHEMDAAWRSWRLDRLPMLPRAWPLRVFDKTASHFAAVKTLLCAPDVAKVVCATDAGREGELIFRYVYRAAGCTKPVERLWLSSLTPTAIAEAFRRLRPGHDFDALADAAEGRSRADWLVGMNLSRAYTVRHGPDLLSVGRVQTPTLAMLVERDRAIAAFVPEKYCEVTAVFGQGDDAYRGTWFDPARARGAPTHPTQPDTSGDADARTSQRLPPDGALAEAIAARCRGQAGEVRSSVGTDKRQPPPLLFDLTELQRVANRLWGLTAKRTLEVAQALYEKHKLLTYPRTDSRHLSQAVAQELRPVVDAIAPTFEGLVAQGSGERPLARRFVDDAKVGDHHAIIPTAARAAGKDLSRDEARVYELVCRRLLMAWHADFESRVTTVVTGVRTAEADDVFRSTGTVVTHRGWKVLDLEPRRREAKDAPPSLPTGLAVGQVRRVEEASVSHKETEPPRPLTDATLLTAMETAGRELGNRELEEAMRERGLGTPATRAAILETLLGRGYAERRGKALHATPRGVALIDTVHEAVKSPSLTGEWELELRRLEAGRGRLDDFLGGIERFVCELVGAMRGDGGSGPPRPPGPLEAEGGSSPQAPPERPRSPSPPAPSGTAGHAAAAPVRLVLLPGGRPPPSTPSERPPPATRRTPSSAERAPLADGTASSETGGLVMAPPPVHPDPPRGHAVRLGSSSHVHPATSGDARAEDDGRALVAPPRPAAMSASGASPARLRDVLTRRFGFARFRPFQEEVCQAVADGADALLVMPTGSGKSLCYQLPGVARGGTTLVISPLIALMEDQTAKLKAQGFAAERIHSGRAREESRAVCRAYLAGELDFLTIAPERLSVPGFPELLARRPPALVAVDEAHCISHWGHDFRPDYRLLGARLPLLKPAPVLALTATATQRVQRDILDQLGIPSAKRFIHGFRRDNLALEAMECPRGARLDEVHRTLSEAGRVPALVYVPSRQQAVDVAAALGAHHRAAPYHAGLDAESRARTQEAFLAGRLDVVVATVAFGMGVDKPDVRTVIHMGLPGSLEGYYQEVGRAGRDGAPSRALLLYAWSDRKLHEHFLERDYPPTTDLESLLQAVPRDGVPREQLLASAALDEEVAEAALDKLWIHGGVLIDRDDVVRPGTLDWQRPYEAMRAHREAQLEEVLDFAQSSDCRMTRLVRHFGDHSDGRACGRCDACRPTESVGRTFRPPRPGEMALARRLVDELEECDGLSTGTLYRRLCPGEAPERDAFERLLAGLERAEVLKLSDDEFSKDGKTIRFRRASLSPRARDGLDSERFLLEDAAGAAPTRGQDKRRGARVEVRRGKPPDAGATKRPPAEASAAHGPTTERIRAWRRETARAQGVPAFRILTDRAMLAIVAAAPKDASGLLRVAGVGPKLVERHGATILRLLRGQGVD